MGLQLCNNSGAFDFRDACVRASWSALLPAILVFLLSISFIPRPESVQKLLDVVHKPFEIYMTLPEAEALDAGAAAEDKLGGDEGASSSDNVLTPIPLWRTLFLSWIALVQTMVWLGVGSYTLVAEPDDVWNALCAILMAYTWLYATARPIFSPVATPPMDLFWIYCLHLGTGIFFLGGAIFDHAITGLPLPQPIVLITLTANLIAVLVLLSVVLNMPLAIPSKRVGNEDILSLNLFCFAARPLTWYNIQGLSVSPEDYTTLLGWITFHWVYPLIKRGTNATLNEGDVWDLSPTMQSRPIFIKFSTIQGSSLLRRLWAANSLDILVDFFLTFVGVIFYYTGPFFLKLILDAVDSDNPTPESRSRAYIYAILAFLCGLFKTQADIQHLWFGRRATTRIRSELMAAIYDKALKRKDFSGIIDKEKQQEAAEKKSAASSGFSTSTDKIKAKEKEDNKDDPRAGADVGKIVNLMAGDANRISLMVSGLYFLYGAPLELIIAGVFLYQLLGISAFAGFFVLIIGWPLNTHLASRSIRIHKGLLAARDKRMSVISELIGAVKFIKFFAWESRWIQRSLDARDTEMNWLLKARINSVIFSLLWTLAPILVSIISFFVFVIQGNELTVSVAFTAIALFNMIRTPLNVIPAWIVSILQTGVALKRIETYLNEDEVSCQVSSLKKTRSAPPDTEDSGLGIENGSFKWNEVEEEGMTDGNSNTHPSVSDESGVAVDEFSAELTDHKFELKDISVMFPEGELSVVTGPTASGKTALLMALLGEMTLLPGGKIILSKDLSRVDENGLTHSISYAAQLPWLRHQSIRDNILFGYPLNEERYNAVIENCALKTDLEILEDGDATEIGARGVNLSGGQKARIALARAVYAPTKYVLLDDPLSAVDSHTSRFLFDRLFCGPLLANRTVILVTHHIDLVLPGTYYLVRMLDGRIDTQGTVKELRAQGVLDDISHDSTSQVGAKARAAELVVPAETDVDDTLKPAEVAKKPRQLVKDEHRETGGVKWNIYKTYLKASSYWTWSVLGIIIVLNQLLGVTEKLWIKTWGEAYTHNQTLTASFTFRSFATAEHEMVMDGPLSSHLYPSNLHPIFSSRMLLGIQWPSAYEHPLFYISIYAAIALTAALAIVMAIYVQYSGALRASRLLFKKLLVGVVHATMRWHDTTPQGRMLNRFGKDIETIDSTLAGSLQAVNSSLATFFAAILTVAVVFPLFLFPAFAIGYLYWLLAIGYLNTGRDLRRMESNTRSPIFSGFTELLEGIVTVRAFSAEKRFLDNLHSKIDVTTKMWYSFWMTNRWLLLNFDALGALAVLVTTLFALSGFVSAGLAGLCITSAMAFTSSVYWACRFWTALELDLNSVERIVEYLDLPQEPPAIIESNRPPAYWPSSSNKDALISVEDLVIKYAPELPPVLHGVSFTLKAGERVGLLGRTGSGKSTLAMSIMRFVDPMSGRILIDGIDISTIGVHDLRSRLTFIPQDATLFSGTLRDNLDPFNEHDDNECLDVLYRVQMLSESAHTSQHTSRGPSRASSIHGVEREDTAASISTAMTDTDSKTAISLDSQVSAGGTNFSQGQRQLIAMARALLRRSSVIILDEATSSIDFATDAKIQNTIRAEFNDSLLLTVAHRLRTVIDYDRLIVLDKGQIIEFDTPLRLINKDGGAFRNMCLKSGTFAELEAAAIAKAERDLDQR